MKIERQKHTIWGETPYNRDEAILWIERAGRNCYKSASKIVPGSGEKFVTNIVKSGHCSVIEQSNFIIRTKYKSKFTYKEAEEFRSVFSSKFLNVSIKHDKIYVQGNWRAWWEWYTENFGSIKFKDFPHSVLADDYIWEVCPADEVPTDLKRITVELYTDRAVMAEITRHRPDVAFSIESQRYCRYMVDVVFILPHHYTDEYASFYEPFKVWKKQMEQVEQTYKNLLVMGEKAEEARSVLPNSTAVNIVMTASIPEWKHIFNLRCSKAAYPQIRNLLTPVKQEFEENGWV